MFATIRMIVHDTRTRHSIPFLVFRVQSARSPSPHYPVLTLNTAPRPPAPYGALLNLTIASANPLPMPAIVLQLPR